MICVGESLNIISTKIGAAFKSFDPEPLKEEAKRQVEAGADYIDLNIGPARKGGDELVEFVLSTVQSAIDIPVWIDTTNVDVQAHGWKVIKDADKCVWNSIMARPEVYTKALPIAAEAGCDIVALMWGPDGLPRDENERAALAAELIYTANEAGIPNEKIWVDGIVTPVNIQQPQLISLLNFQAMLQDIAPGSKSTCGLSNISNGPPEHLRSILNTTYMVMLERFGMYSCIIDVHDSKIMPVAKGQRPDIVEAIHRVMDATNIDAAMTGEPLVAEDVKPGDVSDDPEIQGYVKTAKIILGHSLYSDSWLEV
ncbi:MAG: dihydropteroate synthase [Proteobacteria bacterium]|nr:dihydropteroate synthase [Pseudomonadota bacterium]